MEQVLDVWEHPRWESWVEEKLYTCHKERPSGQLNWAQMCFIGLGAPASGIQHGFQHRVDA